MLKLMLLVGLALALAGCVGPNLMPVYNGDPRVGMIYVDGRKAALSTSGDLSVAVSGARTDHELFLHVGYSNRSGELVDAFPEQLFVEAESGARRRYLHVYTADEYLAKVRTEQNVALFAQALSAVTERQTVQTETHGGGPGGPYYWTTTTRVYGPDVHDFFHLARSAERNQRNLETLERILLGRTTLLPGQSVEGVVAVEYDPAYADRFYVTVPFGGDVHHLDFVFEPR
jgi:hypothetical protein